MGEGIRFKQNGQRKKILTSTRWVGLEGIVLCKRSQRKTNTTRSHSQVESGRAELRQTESRVVAARGWAMGDTGRCWSEGTNFQSQDEYVLRI